MPRTVTPRCGEQRLGLGDGVLAEVEDRRRQHGVGTAVEDALDEVLERADAAAGDHRHADGVDHRPRQLEVEPLPCAVAVHRREQDLPGPAAGGLAGPADGVDARRRAPAVEVHLEPAGGARLASMAQTTHWAPNSVGDLGDQLGRSTAAVLTLTLSAPARSIRRASSSVRTPPPTVNGMNTCSAVR